MAIFGDDDPNQQPLERREIIEASHKAAIQMAEMLGQDANVHAAGAQAGQHAAIPLPKAQQVISQTIKLFLANKETAKPEEADSRDTEHDDQSDVENYYEDELWTVH
jgi:hypothetical protein